MVFALGSDVVVGREPACSVVIDDPLVSRQHLRFRSDAAGWTVEDLGSTRGSFIDGKKLKGTARVAGSFSIDLGAVEGGARLGVVTAGEHKKPRNRSALVLGLGIVLVLVVAVGALAVFLTQPKLPDPDSVIASTAFVAGGTDDCGSSGSASVVGDGLVLTNLHVIQGAAVCGDDAMLQVAAGDSEDRTREELKDAELVAFDAELDLAVLKVADFDQPVVKISKDENVPTGDAIRALGYPSRGNMADDVTLTVTDGIVSGTLKDEFGNQFIKTDTALAPGNSGGSAFAVGGELIGVPTSVSYIECAEAGCAGASFGFIRPIRYAIPLIEQAKDAAVIPLSDVPTEDEGSTTTVPADPSDGGAPIANERFGGVDSDQNEVETPDGTIAAGDTSGACIWFDYEGPATGSLDYSVRLDGEEVSTDSQDVSENPNGFCVSTSGSVPVGEYEISAVLSGEPDTEVVVVGTVT